MEGGILMHFFENDKFKRSKFFRILSLKQIEFLSKIAFKISKLFSFAGRKKPKPAGQVKFYL